MHNGLCSLSAETLSFLMLKNVFTNLVPFYGTVEKERELSMKIIQV
jgi:hypothetical protein